MNNKYATNLALLLFIWGYSLYGSDSTVHTFAGPEDYFLVQQWVTGTNPTEEAQVLWKKGTGQLKEVSVYLREKIFPRNIPIQSMKLLPATTSISTRSFQIEFLGDDRLYEIRLYEKDSLMGQLIHLRKAGALYADQTITAKNIAYNYRALLQPEQPGQEVEMILGLKDTTDSIQVCLFIERDGIIMYAPVIGKLTPLHAVPPTGLYVPHAPKKPIVHYDQPIHSSLSPIPEKADDPTEEEDPTRVALARQRSNSLLRASFFKRAPSPTPCQSTPPSFPAPSLPPPPPPPPRQLKPNPNRGQTNTPPPIPSAHPSVRELQRKQVVHKSAVLPLLTAECTKRLPPDEQ